MHAYTKNQLPIVIRRSNEYYETLLSADDLARCKGDYATFTVILRERMWGDSVAQSSEAAG